LAAWWIINGDTRVSIGELALYGMLIQRLLWPMTRLGKVFDDYQRAKASVKRVFSVMDTPAEIQDKKEAIDFVPLEKGITLKNISFKYSADGQQVLSHLNMFIPKGKTSGIAGPTGAGKTSLIKLLLKYYLPEEGEIYWDNHEMSTYTANSIRKQIALVSQDVYLFQGTIQENIAYGSNDVSDNDIKMAARKAALHDFIVSLKDGYNTLVGERGIKLSGGQRQRLSIARAILKNAPIIILDEATSAVDTETEKIIQENLQLLTEGKTAIIIAHRLSTLKQADIIFLLEDGTVKESGNHEELMVQNGIYSHLWKIQTGD
jgi:ATP-binding cassette subfamily B protein